MSQIWLGRNDPAEGAACLEHFVASFRSWKIKLNWAQLSLTELNWVQSVKGMGRPALIRRIYAISSGLLCYSGNWESQICGWISDNAMKNMFDKGCLLSGPLLDRSHQSILENMRTATGRMQFELSPPQMSSAAGLLPFGLLTLHLLTILWVPPLKTGVLHTKARHHISDLNALPGSLSTGTAKCLSNATPLHSCFDRKLHTYMRAVTV